MHKVHKGECIAQRLMENYNGTIRLPSETEINMDAQGGCYGDTSQATSITSQDEICQLQEHGVAVNAYVGDY